MSETPKSQRPTGPAQKRASDPGAGAVFRAHCAEMPDLAAGYALGALEKSEREAVERHIAGCPVCAALVEAEQRTAVLLPHLVRPVAPPPDVKAALFSRIAQTRQYRPPATSAGWSVPTLPTSRPGPSDLERVARAARRGLRLPSISGLGGARRGWANWPGPALPITTTTVPLILVLAIVGGWAMNQYNRASEAAAYQDLWGAMGSVLSSEDGTVYELRRDPSVPESVTGKVIAELDSTEAMVMVWGLDQLAPEATYEVWIQRDGQLIRLDDGGLDLNSRGSAQQVVNLNYRLKECQRFVIRVATTSASGETIYFDILSTAISPDGPAAGGDGTDGDQSIGSVQIDAVPIASR